MQKKILAEYNETFYVPKEVKEHIDEITAEGAKQKKAWEDMFAGYGKEFPELAEKWNVWHSDKLPVDLLDDEDYWTYEGDIATRASSEKVLNKLSKLVPNLIGGSADLAPSNKSVMKDREYYSPENRTGSNMHFGIREFVMTVIASGMYLHGGLRPYIAGFFVFSDYMKAGLRMSALMQLPVISIFTHDSIGVGEDGPTHQPIERLQDSEVFRTIQSSVLVIQEKLQLHGVRHSQEHQVLQELFFQDKTFLCLMVQAKMHLKVHIF